MDVNEENKKEEAKLRDKETEADKYNVIRGIESAMDVYGVALNGGKCPL